MKKILAIIICGMLVFSLAACRNDTTNATIGGADEPTNIIVDDEKDSQNETSVSGEELMEKVEKLDEIEDPEEKAELLGEIQTILEQAENAAQ